MMMSVQVGQAATDFTLKNTDMQDVTLSSYQGKKNVVLLFVPLAFTGVCTNEMCSVRDNLSSYANLDAEVLGISVDSPFSQKAWKERENLNFTLLSDFNREVVHAYGAQYESLGAWKGVAKRSAFVIDKQGQVQYAEVLENAGNLPNFDKIAETLQSLK
jgi:peroxiredoxin